MVATQDMFTFPVVQRKRGVMTVVKTLEDLTRCTPTALKRGWYSGLSLVDASGTEYILDGARRVKRILTWNPLSPFMYQVELIITRAPRSLSLQSFREELIAAVKLNRDFWDSGIGCDLLVKRLTKAGSFEELRRVVSEAVG